MGKKINHSEFINKLHKCNEHIKTKNIEIISTHIDSRSPIHIKCNFCNKSSIIARAGNLIEGYGCPKCSKIRGAITKNIIITEDKFTKRILDKYGDKYTYISGFKNIQQKEKIIMKHRNGFFIQALPHPILYKNNFEGGEKINKKTSSYEKILFDFLLNYNIKYKIYLQYSFDDLLFNCFNTRFDFFIEDKKILIEVDGELHDNTGFTKKYGLHEPILEKEKCSMNMQKIMI